MTATDNTQADAARLGGQASPIFSSPEMVGDAIMVLDVTIITFACLIAHLGYEVAVLNSPVDIIRMAGVGFFAAVTFAGIYRAKSGYMFDSLVDIGSQIGRMAISWSGAILGLIAIAFILKISATYSRGWLMSWFGLAAIMLVIGRVLMVRAIAQLIQNEKISRHVAIVGVGPLSMRLSEHLTAHRNSTGIKVIGFFDDRAKRRDANGITRG